MMNKQAQSKVNYLARILVSTSHTTNEKLLHSKKVVVMGVFLLARLEAFFWSRSEPRAWNLDVDKKPSRLM